MKRNNIRYRLRAFRKILKKVKAFDFSGLENAQIAEHSQSLKKRATNMASPDNLLPDAFALVSETVKRTLGIAPFDVQLIAAAAMNAGRVIEFPTGEGKTLVAVFVAYVRALSGKGVHVLTFNDYLARRDALWMKPVYDMLDISVGFIQENSSLEDRKTAYSRDITYVTAKEAGFDYLKRFLVYDKNDIVQRDFHYAIIDEADSILIDEARIPLVLAGDISEIVDIGKNIYSSVASLAPEKHYKIDAYAENIYLTEEGIAQIETDLGIENLFDSEHLDTLTKINVILPALHLLEKDIDYIVQDGQVQLVDEFTGRVSKNRQWPDGLHAAVEMKEGLIPQKHGMVMNTVTLQHFLHLYPDFCGMTGTAHSAAPEFLQFYKKSIIVIPPHKPCMRIDHPDIVFTHREAKHQALVEEIRRTHASGRPVLVGTCSVEESELLADMLHDDIPQLQVLNAKNDVQEAEIISEAGQLSAVTISTNMAGRGVDIHLGGKDGKNYRQVCALGGLYIIGTNRHESIRIDLQLRGRAGRQGDPGESQFYISLKDPMLVKYQIDDALSEKFRICRQNDPIHGRTIRSAILHVQHIVEGQTFDAKTTLGKYSFMPNEQRKIVERRREKILNEESSFHVLENHATDQLLALRTQISEDEYLRVRRHVELFAINRCWADHLVATQSAQDGVQMISMLKGDPFLTFNQRLIEGFEDFETHIRELILEIFGSLLIRDGRVDLPQMGIQGPSSTRTYLVHDGTEEQIFINEFASAYFNAPLYIFYMIFNRLFKRRQKPTDQ